MCVTTAFEIVMFIVVGFAVAACFTRFFSVGRALADLGRQGVFWFERSEERDVEELPDENAVDAALPHRPLRARH